MTERKGLRFEIYGEAMTKDHSDEIAWVNLYWRLVGKDDEVYAQSAESFADEADARSNIAKVRKVFKGSGYAKVIVV